MIDWLFEPASNWLVILMFALMWAAAFSKDSIDARRFKYLADALARQPAADRSDD